MDTSRSKLELDPFVFPSETRVRFILLIFAALIVTFNIGFSLSSQFGFPSLEHLFFRLTEIGPFPRTGMMSEAEARAAYLEYLSGNLDFLRDVALVLSFPCALTLGMLGLAALLYYTHPLYMRRQAPVRVASQQSDAEMLNRIDHLAEISGVPRLARVEVEGDWKILKARVFGVRNRYILRIGGKTRFLCRKQADIFRAIILHELAHIANNDIRRTFFSQALWIALSCLVLLPIVWIIFCRSGTASFVAV